MASPLYDEVRLHRWQTFLLWIGANGWVQDDLGALHSAIVDEKLRDAYAELKGFHPLAVDVWRNLASEALTTPEKIKLHKEWCKVDPLEHDNLYGPGISGRKE